MSDGYEMQGRRVRFRGKAARIERYLGDNRFEVRASDDTLYLVHRNDLVFCK